MPRAAMVYISDNEPGIRRIRRGDTFQFIGPDEKKLLTDQAEPVRIASLAILPAYDDVWICMNTHGHLQVTDPQQADEILASGGVTSS